MSTQLLGYLWVPGLHNFLGVREDMAKLNVGGTVLDVAALSNVAGESDQFVPAAGKVLTLSNTGTIAGGDAWTLAIAAAKTLTVSNSLTLAGTDATVMTFPSTTATVARTDAAQTFTGIQTFGSAVRTTASVGTAETGATAVESGDGNYHKTVLTVSTTLPAIAGGANLAVGKLLYTMPAGAIAIHSAKMSLAITQTQGNITADTPDGGLGSVIASGVVATLDGTATFEDILTGQTFNDCNGTAEVKTVANQPMVMETGAAHTVYFNVADGWAASGDAAATLTGTVTLIWSFVG